MLKVKFILFVFCLSLFSNAFSQKGKDAVKTVSVANVKINEFTALTANAAAGNATINVAASSLNTNARFTSTLTPGDLIMIIQMQGAFTKTAFTPAWIHDNTYGYVWDYVNSGNYEFAEVKSVVSATQIEINCGLKYSYTSSGKTQIVRVPRYSSLNITSTGTLTTDAWNGTIGGILVAEVDGNTTVNSGGLISVNGLGFRGGNAVGNNSSGDISWYSNKPNYGAEKGEGIGSDRLIATLSNTATVSDSLGKQCKGAPGNGGGGGNANNCGGGGGGNGGNLAAYNGYGIVGSGFNAIYDLEFAGRSGLVSSGGGHGGYGTSTTTTANINSVGPNNAAWGSFQRHDYGGFGGRPLDYSTGKLFLGGGGGAGHMSVGQSNGAGACGGGNGGGLIYILNYGTISGTGTISANGANGANSFGAATILNPTQGIDGAGGAGAGGTIILQCNGTISSIITNANGGNGGNQIKSGTSNSEGQGPGGGGSGGYIAGNGSVFTQNVNGGTNGTTNATAFDTEFPMNGATSGDVGTSGQIITPSFSLTASANQTICTNQSINVTATSTNSNSTIQWYNSLSGNSIATGTVYTTPTYTAAGTYTVYAGSCPGTYRLPIVITVNTGVTFLINNPTICSGQSTVLTVTTSASTYTWNTNQTTVSITVTPTITTVYTISSSNGTCTSSQNATVTVLSPPSISVPSATICSGTSTVLAASGAATSFTWMPGSIITSTISANSNATYTVTGSNGTCTNSTTATVTIVSLPTVSVPNATICSGTSTVLAASGTATSFTWMPGSITTSTISANSNTNYTITGSNGACTNSTTATVTVVSLPTISVPNATICSGTSTVLAASGTATSFTWMPGSITTSTISANSNTIYTITGSNGTCTNSTTATVTVVSLPTVSVPNATICSGTSTVLVPSGTATSFTWMPGSVTTSTISANSNTSYTITGSNGTCTNSTTATVTVVSLPTVSVPNATICSGTSTVLAASGTATSFTWIPGSITTSTISANSNSNYTITGSNGTCTNSTTATVTVVSLPTVSVPNATICSGTSTVLAASGTATNYTWMPGSITTSTISANSNTTYTITGSNGTCTNSTTATVTVVSLPTVSVPNATICSGTTTILAASGTATSFTWMPGSIATSTISANPNITSTYTVMGSDGVCTNSTTSTVSVTPTPTISGVSNTTICPAQTVTFTAGGAASFTWQPTNFVGSTYTIAPSSNTVISVIGANGTCTTQTTASITIGSNVSIAVSGVTICPNQSATLTASSLDTYTWSTTANTNSIVVTPTSTTVYTVNGTIGTCTGSQTVEVTVVAQPTLSISGNTTICSGSSTTLTASGTATSYTWLAGGQTTNSISVNPNSTTDYTITGSNGVCTNSIISTISVTPTPIITGVSDISICTSQTATFTAGGATTYTWQPTNFVGVTYTIAPSSNTVISVIGSNGTCSSTATASITIGSGASITVNSETICAGQTATLSASGITTYTWNTGSNSNPINVSPTSTTIYTISGNNGSCSGTQTATVTVNTVPVLTVTPNINICSGQTTTLTVSGTPNTYTWNPGNLSGSTQTVSPTSTTIYTVFGTDVNSCINTSITTTTVNVTATPTISINFPTICVGQTATLTATGATSFTWNTTETTDFINPTPVLTTTYSVIGIDGVCTSTATATVSVTPSPSLTVVPSITSGCSVLCVDFFDITSPSTTGIVYDFGDGATANTNNPSHCYTTSGNYTVTATATNSALGCSSTFTLPVINVLPRAVADFNILDGTIATVGSNVNLINTSTNADAYRWDVLCNGITSTTKDFTTTFTDTGNCCIWLVAKNFTGCADTTVKCINIVNEAVVTIPNVFTPNGDIKNDQFKINSVGVKSLNCVIYDRWGLKLYEWDGINGFWDGSAKSGLAPTGTYFYIITYTDQKDKSTTEKGFLTLFRD